MPITTCRPCAIGGQGVALHHIRLGVVDDDVGRRRQRFVERRGNGRCRAAPRRWRRPHPGRRRARHGAGERHVLLRPNAGNQRLADPAGGPCDNDADHVSLPADRQPIAVPAQAGKPPSPRVRRNPMDFVARPAYRWLWASSRFTSTGRGSCPSLTHEDRLSTAMPARRVPRLRGRGGKHGRGSRRQRFNRAQAIL